jgi:hypothetical protein
MLSVLSLSCLSLSPSQILKFDLVDRIISLAAFIEAILTWIKSNSTFLCWQKILREMVWQVLWRTDLGGVLQNMNGTQPVCLGSRDRIKQRWSCGQWGRSDPLTTSISYIPASVSWAESTWNDPSNPGSLWSICDGPLPGLGNLLPTHGMPSDLWKWWLESSSTKLEMTHTSKCRGRVEWGVSCGYMMLQKIILQNNF